MCRIVGVIDPSKDMEVLETAVKEMCRILKHGGPDGEGMYFSEKEHLVFGHRRLALLDLSEAGKQPMTYNEEKYVITYNGEIYNYPILKIELEELGYHFKTVCDTEMILAAFAEWGINAFEKFSGMFALCLFDREHQKVYMARDPSGIKPLYYYQSESKLYFSSEVRAFQIFEELKEKDPAAGILLLAYGHIPEPITTLSKISMLPKGSYLCMDLASGITNVSQYHSFKYAEIINNREEAKNLIKQELSESVKRHLLSDAPIGAFLSGGIDSSLVALLAHEYTGDHLNTLSLYFNEEQYSEKKYQDMIIAAANCHHEQYLLDGQEFNKHFERIISDMDLPSIDGINTWFISKYAKESGLTAVLSGLGADELFGGYPSFRRMNLVKFLKKMPAWCLRLFEKLPNQKLKRLAFLSIPGVAGEYLFLRGIFLPAEIARILNIKTNNIWEVLSKTLSEVNNKDLSSSNQASWIEMNLYMQNQLLRDSDVMSMAHGLEIRVPFLDKELITSTLQMKSDVKFNGELPKQLLIDAFKNILPEPIWNRKKMGFAFPFKEWMKNNPFVKLTLNKNQRGTALYDKFLKGDISWSHLMALMVLENKINA